VFLVMDTIPRRLAALAAGVIFPGRAGRRHHGRATGPAVLFAAEVCG
jgi:hypothetical protein